jgi:RimJ/RimL family protein N-acetyltransferase
MDTLHPLTSEDTPDIQLQRLTLDDTDQYFDLFDANRAHIASHDPRLGNSFCTISSVAEMLSPYNGKHRMHFGIIKQGEFVGSTALFSGRNQQSAEIAYWVANSDRGQGLATHACRLLINHAIINLGKRNIDAVIAPSNEASIRTAQKLGFRHTSTLEDDVVYSLNI